MVLTNIKEGSSIKNPYLNHRLVERNPQTNGKPDISPVLFFCTIFWQTILKNIVLLD